MSWVKRRPPCPSCKGVKQDTLSGGWANKGELPYTYCKCLDCGYIGLQATFWLPPEASMTAIDHDRRAQIRRNQRIRRGQLPQLRKLVNRKGRRLTDDWVDIQVRIIPGKVEAGLAKRLAGLRRKRVAA